MLQSHYCFFFQIVRILAFCHALGIIVRNLKPRKLVFDQQNRIRLENVLDCIVCDDPADDRMVDKYCTPAFAAPEVSIHVASIDKLSS